MTPEHYQTLRAAFRKALLLGLNDEVPTIADLIAYHRRAYEGSQLTPRRMHFDLLYWVDRRTPGRLHDWFHEVYKYANDDHIETAVKAVLKEVTA